MKLILAALLLAQALGAADQPELADHMNRFAQKYNRFTEQLAHGTFDVKAARELSKEWRAVERSGFWPEVTER